MIYAQRLTNTYLTFPIDLNKDSSSNKSYLKLSTTWQIIWFTYEANKIK